MLDRDLEEAEEQYQMALRNHLIHVDQLIELQVILPISSKPNPLNSIHDSKDFINNSKETPGF